MAANPSKDPRPAGGRDGRKATHDDASTERTKTETIREVGR